MIEGIDVAYIHSGNGDALAKWFSDALGVSIKMSFPGWHEMDVAEGRFGIDVTDFPRSVVESQPLMLSFKVADIHAAVAEFAAKGVSFYPDRESTIFDVGPKLVATFCDPDGNWHQLSQLKS